jgi:hypothetical protein
VLHVGSKVTGQKVFIRPEVYQRSEHASDFIHQKLKDGKPSILMESIGVTKGGKDSLQVVSTNL